MVNSIRVEAERNRQVAHHVEKSSVEHDFVFDQDRAGGLTGNATRANSRAPTPFRQYA